MFFLRSNISKQLFSTLTDKINHRVPLVDPENGQKLDNYLNRYKFPIYSAYVYKRRVSREEIYPKIHIIDEIPIEQQHHLKCQQLYPIKNAMDQKTMQRLVKQDPSNINSSYVISIFSQNHFKPMIDQYVKKVLVCGKAPKNQQQMLQIQSKVTQLYKTYYYGQPITQLQRQLQLKYLSAKQGRYISHNSIIKEGKKNEFTRCLWRQQDQRILQDLVNWHKTDIQFDDTNFRPYYEELQLLQRADAIQRMYRLMGITNWWDKRRFNKEIKVYYQISQKHYSLLADKIYNRVHQYINSLEFTNLLKIPPDFMIEMAMYQIHIWLVCQRLQQIDTRDTRYIANLIMENFTTRLQLKVSSFNVKKQNILVRNLHKMLVQNKNVLRLHFVLSDITKTNHYKGIDALVWSILFFEKVQRYGDQVYLMSQYIIKNYQMLQNYNQQDLLNGMIEFDAYNVDPNYRRIIQQINPPLSKQQFEEEFNSDKLQKRYHYSQIQKNVKVPIDIYRKQDQNVKFSLSEVAAAFFRRFGKKYYNMQSMDHYSQIQSQQKQQKKKSQQTIWKSRIDQVKQTKQQFKHVKDIKKQLAADRKRNDSSNITKKNTKK